MPPFRRVIPEIDTIIWTPHGMSPEEVILRIPDEFRHLLKEIPTYETMGHLIDFHTEYVSRNLPPRALLVARCIVRVEQILGIWK